jgi:hypothetical protein
MVESDRSGVSSGLQFLFPLYCSVQAEVWTSLYCVVSIGLASESLQKSTGGFSSKSMGPLTSTLTTVTSRA